MATTVKYYQSVTFMGGAELQNPRIENQSSSPASGYIGQMYYNTQDSCLYVCYQTSPSVAWKKVGAGGAIVQADSSVTNPAINVASSTDTDGITTYKLSVQGLANSNISTNAAIAWSKLATGTANRLLYTNGSGVVAVTPFTVGAGGTGVAGNINVAGYRVTNVADPTDGSDAINFTTLKAWFSGNVDIHEPCDVATTANIALTGSSVPTTIDGVDITTAGTGTTLRVLVWKQTSAIQNGIYDWVYNSSTGKATLTRSSDCNENTELYPGSTTYVIGGNTYAATGFVQKDQGSGVGGAIGIGSEANEWVENYSIAKINAGAGLTRTGNTISVNQNSTLMIDTNSKVGLATVTVTTTGSGASNTTPTLTVDDYGRVSAITYNSIKIAAGDITSGVLAVTKGGTGLGTIAKGDLLYGSASNTLSRLAIGGTTNAGKILYNTGTLPEWKSLSDAGIASTGHTHQITKLQIGDDGLVPALTSQFLRKQTTSGAGSTSTPVWSYIDATDLYWCNTNTGTPVLDNTKNGVLLLTNGVGAWLTLDSGTTTHGNLFLGVPAVTSGTDSGFGILDFDEAVAAYLTGLGTAGVVRVDNGNVSLGQVSLGSTTDVTGVLPLANGGTGADLSSTSTYKQWGVVYRASATALSMTAAGTANRPLVGNGSAAPKWAGYALPASLTANTILVATSTTAVGCTNVLPFTLGIEQGGTGATSASAARTNLETPRYFTQQITDWTTQDYTVTHSYGTADAVVQLYEVTGSGSSATYEKIDVGLTVTPSTIILSSAKAGIMSGKTLKLTAMFIG